MVEDGKEAKPPAKVVTRPATKGTAIVAGKTVFKRKSKAEAAAVKGK